MNFHVMTLFPEMINSIVGESILGRAINKGLISVNAVNSIACLIRYFCQKLLVKKALPKVSDVLHRLSVLISSAHTNSYDFHFYIINCYIGSSFLEIFSKMKK